MRGAGGLLFLAVRDCLVNLTSGKLHLCLSPHKSKWDTVALLLWSSVAACPICVASGETTPARDGVRGGRGSLSTF